MSIVKRSAVSLGAALAVALGTFVATPDASQAAAPPITKFYAHEMGGRHIQETTVVSGPPNNGVQFVVKSRLGRQLFFALKYRNARAGVRWWKHWSDGWIARKGKVLVIPQGAPNVYQGLAGKPYRKAWARFAARRVDGRIVRI